MKRDDSAERLISPEECKDIILRVQSFCSDEGELGVRIKGEWYGELSWARNRAWVGTDRRIIAITIQRMLGGRVGQVNLNQSDNESLRAGVIAAERIARRTTRRVFNSDVFLPPPPSLVTPETVIWSDETYNVSFDIRGEIARRLIEGADNADMLSAGDIEVNAGVHAFAGPWTGNQAWDDEQRGIRQMRANEEVELNYMKYTQAQCSLTVRHPQGLGSGWAGLSSYDWKRIDGQKLAGRALEKCILSLHPVRIEPGRYTLILEPQAVYDFLERMMDSFARYQPGAKFSAETGEGPWKMGYDAVLSLWRTKLGMQVVDERITISHDPFDSELGVIPFPGMASLTWIERGRLKTLEHGRTGYALPNTNADIDATRRKAFRMSGGTQSVDDMVLNTKRGLLVSRLFGVLLLDHESLLSTGVTRDGLWLIENGQITKSVHNMRFTESPIFALNQLEGLGVPVPVFSPYHPAIIPAVKVNDFSFTSLSDAV